MGIYLETQDKEFIIKKLQGTSNTKSIAIIGCAGCANMSCSINRENHPPIRNIFFKPTALNNEIQLIKDKMLKDFEIINHGHIMAICSYSSKKEKKIQNIGNNADIIIALSCAAGIESIKIALKHDNIIPGMKLKGFKSMEMKLKKEGIYCRHTK